MTSSTSTPPKQETLPAVVPLEGAVGLQDAVNICSRLKEIINEFTTMEIDARQLTGIDVSVVQLLIAAHKSARQQGKVLTVRSKPDGPLTRIAAAIGFTASDQNDFQIVRNEQERQAVA